MLTLISSIIALIFALTIHEFSHAWMANRLGDPTARILGRLTLNPLKHFDIFGTLSLILFGFGWGKPVPFNPENLKHPKRDAALVALAGPFSNVLTALVFAIPLKYLAHTDFASLPIYQLIYLIFHASAVFFSLNVLPLPPFDGSKIIGLLIPARHYWRYEKYLEEGIRYVILFILFDVLVLARVFHFSVLDFLIGNLTFLVKAGIYLIT